MTNPMLQHIQQNGQQQGTNVNANGSPIQQAMEYIKANGGDARSAFYKLAREKGVDPESVLRRFR